MRAMIWLGGLFLAGCGAAGARVADDDLTSVGGTAQTVAWDSFVYVDPSADDATISATMLPSVTTSTPRARHH